MNIQKLLEESRERTLRIKEQKIEEENEKYRLRNIHEAEQIINSWKREFKRIKKNKIRISVRREYNSYFDRFYYKLRCFVDGKLYEDFNNRNIDESWVREIESRDNIFPVIDYRMFRTDRL